MRSRPRVFLSHSKADEEYISRIYEDLRKCQIDPWLDSVDIRHGEPWLDAIFDGGISNCDCILIYLTENSLNSAMVKKEIDASVIQKLKDEKIKLLPYVSESSLRLKLRADVQSLQTPEWNSENYNKILPRVVAEIWHGYFERALSSATSDEKVKRLQAELDLTRLKEKQHAGIFSQSEITDFKFMYSQMNKREKVIFKMREEGAVDNAPETEIQYSVSKLSLLQTYAELAYNLFEDHTVSYLLEEALRPSPSKKRNCRCVVSPLMANELLMFGLVQNVTYTKNVRDSWGGVFLSTPKTTGYVTEVETRYEFTPKVHRFRYWLAVEGLTTNGIDLMPMTEKESQM